MRDYKEIECRQLLHLKVALEEYKLLLGTTEEINKINIELSKIEKLLKEKQYE